MRPSEYPNSNVSLLCRLCGIAAHLRAWLALSFVSMCLSLFALGQASAQANANLVVEVLVADQGSKQRNSAYWLAFDQVLRRHVEPRIALDPVQREDLMKDPSLYVQTFRYRKYNAATDNARTATRLVRDGAAPTAVISVSFPPDLAAIVQQQLIPIAVEDTNQTVAPVIALVAVEQQGGQFIIGGERGKKFQSRAMQLAAANNLQLEFPTLDAADQQLINAADILAGDVERINGFVSRYNASNLLTGALFLLSPNTWQSDWTYLSSDQQQKSFSLTTATLDEALVAAMTQISPGGGYLGSTYNDGSGAGFEQSGVEFKVENIRSLADYNSVINTLRQVDAGIVTDALEFDAVVFRATDQGAPRLRDSLIASRNFEPLNTDQFSGALSFRYQAR